MSYDEQQKEIATIKERTITVKLSDADCARLMDKCGACGLTVGELIENFIGDLVCGTYSNGSDEREYANRWFDRCGFSMFPEKTLLNYFLWYGMDPEEYLNMLESIEDEKKGLEYIKQHPELPHYENDLEAHAESIADYEEELKTMTEDWKPEGEPDMEEEISRIKKWVEEKEQLLRGKEVPT